MGAIKPVVRPVEGFPKNVTRALLAQYLGQSVDDFCNAKDQQGGALFYKGDSQNHCAHFVSHVLGFRFGELCMSEKYHGTQGRTMRVNDLFNSCENRGPWDERSPSLDPCLIFSTIGSNVTTPKAGKPVMSDNKLKHVGVWIGGEAFNYHNGKKGTEAVATDGLSFFKTLYGSGTVCYYAAFPS